MHSYQLYPGSTINGCPEVGHTWTALYSTMSIYGKC
jgi:hypothetical protein